MGCKLLNEEAPTQNKTNTQIFEECFPFYLAIGMTAAEYWEGDPKLAQYYRKAYKLKQEEFNNNAWLQGMYFYDALSTALHNALRGKNTQARDYTKQPYDFKQKETPEKEAEIAEKQAAAWMEQFVQINSKSQSHRARAK